MTSLSRFKLVALIVAALGVGFAGGFFTAQSGETSLINSISRSFAPLSEQGTQYSFVHPLLTYRTPEATLLGEYVSLKDSLQSIVDATTKDGTSRVALYFRDLDAAHWIGINQNDTYYPASLLKVPTMMALYKESEGNPRVLGEDVTYDPSVLPDMPFDAPSTLVPGKVYPVRSLIEYMIADSDNGATFTLLNRLNPELLHQVYTALGIPDPGDDSQNYQISARTYALFFRILYNATYLTPANSEQALKVLSQSMYTKGLVAGVPKGTRVAYKYGEHVLSKSGQATGVELSDCGIVYYPSHPYLLCVMTRNKDEATAATTIASISKTTYDAVAARYGTAK